MTLPSWATEDEKGRIVLDPDIVYPLFLGALGMEPTVHTLECCRLVATKLIHNRLGGMIRIYIPKRERWALKLHSTEGRPILVSAAVAKLERMGRTPQ